MPTITPERARELRAAATPGPWEWAPQRPTRDPGTHNPVSVVHRDAHGFAQLVIASEDVGGASDEDAALLAAAPDLAETVEAQGAELARLRRIAQAAQEVMNWVTIVDRERPDGQRVVRARVECGQELHAVRLRALQEALYQAFEEARLAN